MQQQFKHSWSCYHDADDMQVLCNIYENVDKSILRSICHRGGNEKGCHDNDNETVTRQCPGSGNSIEILMQRRSVRMRAKDGGALPDTGCPMSRQWWQGKRGATCTDNSSTEQTRASHTSHMHLFTGGRLRIIPSKRASGTVLVRCKGEEVDVLARSRVDGRGSRDLDDGSGTCLSLHEFP